MSSTLKAAILALKGRIADAYTAIVAKGGTLPATQDSAALPAAIASIPSGGGLSTDGVTPTPTQDNLADWVAQMALTRLESNVESVTTNFFYSSPIKLTSIRLPNCTYIVDGFYEQRRMTEFYAPNLQSVGTGNFLRECNVLAEAVLPEMLSYNFTRFFQNCTALRKVHLDKIASIGADYTFSGCNNLIELKIGGGMTSSFSIVTWSPTQALRSDVSTLVDSGESFANNLEKLLYNIRTYIAAELRTDVGNNTITFSAAVKAAINADPTTLAAFPSNWTIA